MVHTRATQARYNPTSLALPRNLHTAEPVDGTPCTAYLAADGAHADLIWHGRAGLYGECNGVAVATT